MTHPQSRSDHVPGKTTTPNFTPALRFDVEAEVLDHMVGEQLAAHGLHALASLVLARGLEVDLDVLADPHVRDLAKAERREALLHRQALRVVDHRLGGDDHFRSDHGRGPLSIPHVSAISCVSHPWIPHVSAKSRGIMSRSWACAGTAACRPGAGRRSGSAGASG